MVTTLDNQVDDNSVRDLPIPVAIVTTVRDRRDITLQCLRSLARIDRTGLDITTIVVDDGSTDGTAEAIAEQFADVEIITGSGDLWCSGGNNLGVERALERGARYVLVINDDTVFDSRFLRRMVDTARANPRSVIGALLLLWNEPHRVFQVAPHWETLRGGWRHNFEQTVWTIPDRPFDVEMLAGNCFLVPATAFREHGLFATRWLPHCGDSEFTPRLRKLGWRVLVDPLARAFCQPNDVPPKMSQMTWAELYDVVWRKYNHAHNLRNRFMTYWLGAPTRLHGFAGFVVYTTRLAMQALGKRPQRESTLR